MASRLRLFRRALRSLCTSRLTHLDSSNQAKMVDVTPKSSTIRAATAKATVHLPLQVHALLQSSLHTSPTAKTPKGDVFTTAQLAGILAAKQTSALIPLCHPLPLSHISVTLTLNPHHVQIISTVKTPPSKTGVEMEALTAASVAALTVYDMCKAASKEMSIQVSLESKSGGQSGEWTTSSTE